MDNVALVLSEVDQVDTVLFGVQGSLVHPSLAVVDDDLSKKDKNFILGLSGLKASFWGLFRTTVPIRIPDTRIPDSSVCRT